jgi:hypothetical protein
MWREESYTLDFKSACILARSRAKSEGVPVSIRRCQDNWGHIRWELFWDDGHKDRTEEEIDDREYEERAEELERDADATQAFVDSFDRSDNYSGVVRGAGGADYDSDEYYKVDTIVTSGDEKDLI